MSSFSEKLGHLPRTCASRYFCGCICGPAPLEWHLKLRTWMVEQTFEFDYHCNTDLKVQNKAPKFEMSLEVHWQLCYYITYTNQVLVYLNGRSAMAKHSVHHYKMNFSRTTMIIWGCADCAEVNICCRSPQVGAEVTRAEHRLPRTKSFWFEEFVFKPWNQHSLNRDQIRVIDGARKLAHIKFTTLWFRQFENSGFYLEMKHFLC